MKHEKNASTFAKMSDFWIVLGMLIVGYFIFSLLKYFILNVVVLSSNEQIHK